MNFYPDIKDGMSPSALDSFHNSRSSFVKSYFADGPRITTKAMEGGNTIHALIEAGIMPAKKIYEECETGISIEISEGYVFRGVPDSHQAKAKKSVVEFVDYKSGKANEWRKKLPSDLKMRATAWLVWKVANCPEKVIGHIEYIPTEWDAETRTVRAIADAESEIITTEYPASMLEGFTATILKTMDDVNEAYEKWLTSTDEFMDQSDMQRYAELREQSTKIAVEMEEITERLLDQMDVGGKSTVPNAIGTFYITERKTWNYPDDLTFEHDGEELNKEDFQEIESAYKGAKKTFELENEPVSVSRSMGFRAPKQK